MTRRPIRGETWVARATQATAEIVEVRATEGSVVYRRSEPGFPHVGQPWCTPLVLFLDAFAPPEDDSKRAPRKTLTREARARLDAVVDGYRHQPPAPAETPFVAIDLATAGGLAYSPDPRGLDDDGARVIPPRPCCRRIGEGWCYLDAGHEAPCMAPPPRPLPVSDFGPGRARR